MAKRFLLFTDKERCNLSLDMDQFQKAVNATTTSNDLCRLNQFTLRETEDGTYQFITMPPRSIEQEYIDHVNTRTITKPSIFNVNHLSSESPKS